MEKKILDVTCGARSIWFNKRHPLAIYFDRRDVEYEETFGTIPRTRHTIVHPDVVGDFTALPFDDNTFFSHSFPKKPPLWCSILRTDGD